ncbi:hypothetical protein [Patulibacter minatonensis]|uniref:hypothetical protein n=1 Tax=Patulibacter minatonensis TaxID=298163 RepID=UPI00047EBDE3|nr:hypothetical protein [Patulibacter minatonensis]
MQPRPLLLAAATSVALAAAGCGGSDAPKPRPVAADDPASLRCRQFPTPRRETCESSFFACAEDRADIVYDMDRGKHPSRRAIADEYARAYWGEWDEPTRVAARRGCSGGLPR